MRRGLCRGALTFSYGRALQEDALKRLGRQGGVDLGRPEGVFHAREIERSGRCRNLQELDGKARGVTDSFRRRDAALRAPGATRQTIEPRILHHRDPLPGYAVNGRAIFAGLDMDFPRGNITAIMGPSGTGKTTLLRLITGQIRADSGSVLVAGEDMRYA